MISSLLIKAVFTEGLLFLSGFGLFYSFTKNRDLKSFYKRRFLRLYVPFLILSFPLYTYFLFDREGYGLVDYIGQLTTIYFWVKGNFGGMWYVSISLLLYLLFPMFYCIIAARKESQQSTVVRTTILLLCIYVFLWALWFFVGDYYDVVEIGLGKIPFFILGILFGYEAFYNKMSNKAYGLCIIIFFLLYIIFALLNHRDDDYWINYATGFFQKLSFSFIICSLFLIADNNRIGGIVIRVFNWLGKYSLELYILHLHFYMFFHFGFLRTVIPVWTQATMAVLLAVMFCVPVNRFFIRLTC